MEVLLECDSQEFSMHGMFNLIQRRWINNQPRLGAGKLIPLFHQHTSSKHSYQTVYVNHSP